MTDNSMATRNLARTSPTIFCYRAPPGMMALDKRRLWLTVYVALALPAIVWLFMQAFPIVASTLSQHPYDGKVDWFAARGWWQGVNPFGAEQLKIIKLDGLGHPPTTPFWFLPLAHFELNMMSFVLAECVIVLLLVELAMLAGELGFAVPVVTAPLMLGILLVTPWMAYHLRMAQISGVIAFLYFIAWYLLRRGKDTEAGVALGLACTLKLFPGLLVLCLLLTRRLRAFVAAGAAWMAVNVVMLSRYGLVAWRDFFAGNKIITEYWIGTQRNASIYGIVLRLMRPSCLGPRGSSPLGSLYALLISAALFVLFWRLTRRAWRRPETLDLPFMIFALLSYFCNPWIWEHYNIFLVVPLLLAGTVLWRARRDIGWPTLMGGGVVLTLVAVILMFMPLGWSANLRGQLAGNPLNHRLMHLAEVANWIPPVLLMALSGWILHWSERRNRTALLLTARS
jgi:hypothetical protein